jgi:hypothetical protein
MARRQSKKSTHAEGFLVDENVPAEVSDLIASHGYKVAHIGRTAPYLLPAPAKGTKDPQLKKWVQRLILITEDKGLLEPGGFPNKHRGVFVLDLTHSSAIDVIESLFIHPLFFTRFWKDDFLYINRRFRVAKDRFEEVALDGSVSGRIW